MCFARSSLAALPSGRTSVVALGRSLGFAEAEDSETFRALGTYAACVTVALGGRSITLASIHTSPSQLGEGTVLRTGATTRSCEVAPWWADALTGELLQHKDRSLLIAGDLNEARAWDMGHRGHTCSAEFFDAIRRAGITDITFRDWNNEERPTRRNPDYQLDHVLASDAIAELVDVQDVQLIHDDFSDHAAITFHIAG